jgi:DNA-binding response OmpR family regulator
VQSDYWRQGRGAPGSALIIVVDDEPSVLDTVSLILAHAGFRVLAAASPEEALRIAAERTEPIDLLLADVILPRLSGPCLAEQFARLHPESRWMFMAGLPDSPEVIQLLGRGLPFLAKPFYPRDLVGKVREVLAAVAERTEAPTATH